MFVLVYVLCIQAEKGVREDAAIGKGRVREVGMDDEDGDKSENGVIC
jgi:hypothetical protein